MSRKQETTKSKYKKRKSTKKEREGFYKNFNYVGVAQVSREKDSKAKAIFFFFFITRLHSTVYARCSLNKMFVFLLHRQDASKRREHIGRVVNGTRYTEAREEGGIKKKMKEKRKEGRQLRKKKRKKRRECTRKGKKEKRRKKEKINGK